MTSTRLPGKVLADIEGAPLLERMLTRVRREQLLDDVLIATTVNATADPQIAAGKRTVPGVTLRIGQGRTCRQD